jgi:regulator of cell morphogenesis and NO signaling
MQNHSMLTAQSTLAEIASTHSELLGALERLGLDYCCGGQRSLAEACQEKQLDPELVVQELTRLRLTPARPADWLALTPAKLVDHLEATHHRYLKEALPRLDELAAKVSRVHGERHPELIRVAAVVAEIRADLEPHLRKEEEMLFPMVRTLVSATSPPGFHCGSITRPITLMEREHIVVGELLEQLRTLTHGYQAPEGTCASTQALMAGLAELEADTHLHVHKENNHLFPAVTAMEERLTVGDQL